LAVNITDCPLSMTGEVGATAFAIRVTVTRSVPELAAALGVPTELSVTT
jgi:hypothetical protein